MRVKEESEKAGSKLNIQEMKIMASGPITSWQTDGEKVEAVMDFIFLGSKITAVTVAMKLRHLLLGRKTLTNLLLLLLSHVSRVRFCDPLNRSTPGLPIHHQIPEVTQTHVC